MAERKQARSGRSGVGKRTFQKKEGTRKPYAKRSSRDDSNEERPRRNRFDDDSKPKRNFKKRDDDYRPKRKFNNDDERPRRRFDDDKPKRRYSDSDDRPKRRFNSEGGTERPKRRFSSDNSFDKKREYGDKPRRRFNSDDKPRRNFKRDDDFREKREFNSDEKPRRRFNNRDDKPRRNFKRDDDFREKREFNSDEKPRRRFNNRDDKPRRNFKRDDDFREKREFNSDEKPRRRFNNSDDKPRRNFNRDDDFRGRRNFDSDKNYDKKPRYDYIKSSEPEDSRVRKSLRNSKKLEQNQPTEAPDEIRLNKFIANSGVCSRREADTYIKAGVVSVNGTVVTELGTKISPSDDVRFNGEPLHGEKKVYLLMNKPKGYVTTVEDPHADKTVMDIVKEYCNERIYPVGRLDKNTTGVLLLTNDGELTKQLTHPSYEKKKIYSVGLDKNLTKNDMQHLADGVELEDGLAYVDAVAYDKEEDKKKIGVEIHSGRNRIIRRMFEFMGYKVTKLDRVYFAGLTKAKLRRGECRFLTEKEIGLLKSGRYE